MDFRNDLLSSVSDLQFLLIQFLTYVMKHLIIISKHTCLASSSSILPNQDLYKHH